ncbi:MAG: hypothetical protein NT004_19135 [Bacteroidetes bacterium]|nr:hypothetical protein [Bacteroidota bacterium]
MSLISASDVISLAYLTEIDRTLVKDEVIQTAELKYIKPVLTSTLYADVVTNSGNYSILISEYIKPCLAFFVKASLLNQQLLETAQYTPGADPAVSPSLIEVTTAVLIPPGHRRDTLKEVLSIAYAKQSILKEYVIAQNYPLYTIPTSRRVSGFRITTNS